MSAALIPAADSGALDPARLLASLPGAVIVVDDEHVIRFANDGAESFFERSRARMLDRPIAAVVQFDSERLNAALVDRDENLSAQNMALRDARGQALLADLAIVPLAGHPGWRLIMLTRRPAEPEHIGSLSPPGEQASLGAPAVLSHEIKNPLAGIKGAAQLLNRRVADSERGLTALIIEEVDRIASIIDQMQNLGTRGPKRIEPTNIHSVLNRAVQSVRAANPLMPDLRIDFDPSLPDVLIDGDAMMQVLVNLIQNAVDVLAEVPGASGTGRDPAIVVFTRFVMGGSLRRSGSDGAGARAVRLPVEVAIIDNGPGVPRDIQSDIFAPFVTSKRDGQGLGLAIVRKLMSDMHGRVVYERDEPRGLSQFRLFLPVAEPGRGG